SSTAFAIQILRERGDLTTPWGDRAFSILLFQDLAIVPLLAMVSLLSPWGGGGESFTLSQIAIGVGAICGLIVVGHYLLRPLFHILAATKSDEIFTAAALLVVIGSAILMQVAGLSMALGAFLAGVLLAESEFRHQLESDIEPFRGLLLGLLFIAIGATVSLQAVAENWVIVVLGALGLVALKFSLLFGLCRSFGSSNGDAMRISGVLSQGGEFGFVLFTVAMGVGLITQRESNLLTAIVTVTMALTPIVMLVADRILHNRKDDMSEIDLAEHAQAAPVIVVGFGRFGQVIARILKLRGYGVTLIDSSPERIRIARTFDNKVFFGDVSRGDILRIAGAEQARAIFLCADDHGSVVQATRTLRERFPHVLIFARAHDRVAKVELRKAGADVVIREMFESSVAMAREALDRFGDGEIAEEIVEEFRRRDAELLRLQSEFGSEKGYEKMREEFDLQNEKAAS
ncbi:MAG: cation:proton antiporter, partial [Pseudomonadota bacterium]